MPGNGNPDDLLKQLFGDVVFSYTDAQAMEDGILIPFVANGRDTRHRITNNAYTELKEYYRGKGYSDYDEKQFYYFFFNELLPLVPASFKEWQRRESWNIFYPERVLAIHQAYLDAGSQLITTNTFGATRFVLSHYDFQSRVAELNRAGARLAREVAGERAWVMGSVGPCGGFLERLGELTARELENSLRGQIGGLLRL